MGSNLINLMDLLIESSKSKSGGESGRINCKISITFQKNIKFDYDIILPFLGLLIIKKINKIKSDGEKN